jgi:hypothetical protein
MTDLFFFILLLVIIFVIILFVILVTFVIIVRITILFKILGRLLLALHASLSKLLHHLEEFLPIILEKVIRNGEDVACERKMARE